MNIKGLSTKHTYSQVEAFYESYNEQGHIEMSEATRYNSSAGDRSGSGSGDVGMQAEENISPREGLIATGKEVADNTAARVPDHYTGKSFEGLCEHMAERREQAMRDMINRLVNDKSVFGF